MKISEFLDPPPEGRWFDYMPERAAEGTKPSRLLIARIGTIRASRALHKMLLPHADKARTGDLDDDTAFEIQTRIMAENVWIDTEGAEDDDGNPITLTVDDRFTLLSAPNSGTLYAFVTEKARLLEEEHAATLEASRKNSSGSSSGRSNGRASGGGSSSGKRSGRAAGSRSRKTGKRNRRSMKT